MSGIVALGETMGLVLSRRTGGFDLVSEAEISFGGAESNVAIGASRLGAEAQWIGRLGDDAVGRRVLRGLRAEGVAAHVELDPDRPTGLMLKERPRPGQSRVTYYRAGNSGSRLAASGLPLEIIASADVLHVTGIGLALSASSAKAVLAAVAHARAHGVIVSFDVNHRASLWSADEAREAYRALAGLADVIFAGDDEAAILVGEGTPTEQARALQALGAPRVVVKLGERGALAVDGEAEASVAAFRVPVIDTVGAGDAFVAGYLVELVAGRDLADRLRTAAAAGAFACGGEGDWESLPSRADVAALIAGGGDPVRR